MVVDINYWVYICHLDPLCIEVLVANTLGTGLTAGGTAKAALGGAAAGGMIGTLILDGALVGAAGGPAGALAGLALGAVAGVAIYGHSRWRAVQPIGACSCCEQRVLAGNAEHGTSTCAKCGASVCTACRRSNPLAEAFVDSDWVRTACLCPSCSAEASHLLENAKSLEVYAAAYKGAVSFDANRPQADIQSDFLRSQEEAELNLRLLAAEQGFNLVAHRRYEFRQRQDGNYVYKAWRASGLACYKGE